MGPAIIITVGILFLIQEVTDGGYNFGQTYPVILIVIGAILLGSSLAPMDGHISSTLAVATPPASGTGVAPGPGGASGTGTAPNDSVTGQGQ
jgi:hypothetical protein